MVLVILNTRSSERVYLIRKTCILKKAIQNRFIKCFSKLVQFNELRQIHSCILLTQWSKISQGRCPYCCLFPHFMSEAFFSVITICISDNIRKWTVYLVMCTISMVIQKRLSIINKNQQAKGREMLHISPQYYRNQNVVYYTQIYPILIPHLYSLIPRPNLK